MTEWRFEHGDLVVAVSRTGAEALVSWRGVSDARNPSALLNETIRQVAEYVRGADVTVDFTKLEYMNSATVAPLIGLIKALDAGNRPILVLFSDADWQRTHLNCMTIIGRILKHVRVEGRSGARA